MSGLLAVDRGRRAQRVWKGACAVARVAWPTVKSAVELLALVVTACVTGLAALLAFLLAIVPDRYWSAAAEVLDFEDIPPADRAICFFFSVLFYLIAKGCLLAIEAWWHGLTFRAPAGSK